MTDFKKWLYRPKHCPHCMVFLWDMQRVLTPFATDPDDGHTVYKVLGWHCQYCNKIIDPDKDL